MVDKYDTIGIDCVAMNVNDLICVGATPLSLVDYIAVENPYPDFLEEIGKGLVEGAKQANVSIPGGETSQLPDMITGMKEGYGFDLVGTAIGAVELDKVLVGQDIVEGDVVIGIESNGIHSNGLTLARHVFFTNCGLDVAARFDDLSCTISEELLEPTHIYVREALDLLSSGRDIKALVHITSDGFLNLTRVKNEVGYEIDSLPAPPPIFDLIQQYGNVPSQEMYRVFNMGVGFCIVVSAADADAVMELLKGSSHKAHKIGYATNDHPRSVRIPQFNLLGRAKEFFVS